MAKGHDAGQLALQGRVAVELQRAKLGDRVMIVVEGTLRAFETVSSSHAGDYTIAKARTGEAIILSDQEAQQFAPQLDELRHLRNGGVRGQEKIDAMDTDEFTNMSLEGLRVIANDRGFDTAGFDAEELRDILRG